LVSPICLFVWYLLTCTSVPFLSSLFRPPCFTHGKGDDKVVLTAVTGTMYTF
jgi:hypothetical protein